MKGAKTIITPDEAIPLIWDNGKDVHNIALGSAAIGATWGYEDAIDAIRKSTKIIICDFRNHRLLVTAPSGRLSLFETDDDKVDALLKLREVAA